MKKVGFIGLGLMGKPMSTNLLKAGYSLTVYSRSPGPVEEIVAKGAVAASSPEEVAKKLDVIITMLPDAPDVEKVVLGPSGVISGASPGSTVIDMSTISPKVTREIGEKLREKDVNMLDAPVSGGQWGAIEGTLSIMVGGPKQVFDECLPILQALGKNIVYEGENGAGQTTKLCNQIIVSLNMLAVCEGLILGAKAGLDMNKLLEAVSAGAAGSWSLSNLAPRILKGDLEPGFKIAHQQKDLRHVLSTAEELGLPLPGTALVHELYKVVESEGLGGKGTQGLIIALQKMAKFKVSSE